ncbi:hypothetical protein RDABS01_011047 [Bienertia sinuspersici]
MGSEQNRFPQQERRKKWGGCWGGLPCFGGSVQKGGKRIVPATRTPDANNAANQSNGAQGAGLPTHATSIAPHLLAPPSSPASFSNSGLPSTAQSPRCDLSLSANSPGGPSNTIYATGPYANETQLVTPPVFSTFTTEPSTAPLTPPPELAHLTTPSSPDVPFAQFLSSSAAGKANYVHSNDFQATYPYSPGSPASSLRSPVSRTSGDYLSFPERESSSPWDASLFPRSGNHPRNTSSQTSNFFCPATFAQFYLDQPHSGGRLSISKESDGHSNGTVNQSKQSKNTKHDVEEIEAYRASFGFSADEMITTPQYVEITDVMDDSFTMTPCTSTKSHIEEATLLNWGRGGSRKSENNSHGETSAKPGSDINSKVRQRTVAPKQSGDEQPRNTSGQNTPSNTSLTDDEDMFSNMGKLKNNRKSNIGHSCSDAEIEYRRGRSLRECRRDLTWHHNWEQHESRKKWGGCWGGLPCFGGSVQKGGKRIVPATRTPDANNAANQSNGAQGAGLPTHATSIAPHLLAPPSSPASFSNSGLPSTAQSPRCDLSLSANSPGGPSNTIYATGPYANETQLVTPPVFSTFTTEPSTAPLTPPPELAHLTTPSSPDVPFAQFLSSSAAGKANYVHSNDFQATYPYSPGSPASSLRSPVSRTSGDYLSFPERESSSPWDASLFPRSGNHPRNTSSQTSNFFCPATFAQFYLDQPHSGGRLSISKESDGHSNGTVNQSKQSKNTKHDVEEIEAYRASFGFSADEMITTPQYVEITDVMDDSFTMTPCTSTKSHIEEATLLNWGRGGSRKSENNSHGETSAKPGSDINSKVRQRTVAPKQSGDEQPRNTSGQNTPSNTSLTDDEDMFSNMGKLKNNRKSNIGHSCSDAEIEYRRGRSLRECRRDLTWQ